MTSFSMQIPLLNVQICINRYLDDVNLFYEKQDALTCWMNNQAICKLTQLGVLNISSGRSKSGQGWRTAPQMKNFKKSALFYCNPCNWCENLKKNLLYSLYLWKGTPKNISTRLARRLLPKGPCEFLSSLCVRRRRRRLFTFSSSSLKPLNRFQPNLAEMLGRWSFTRLEFLVLIGNTILPPGPIMCSNGSRF